MVPRRYRLTLRRLLRHFPAVTVLGPRQCGKTTFIRQALPAWTYLDLERPSDAAPMAADPEARLASAFQRAAPGSQPYFWRTAQGDEVDCLIDRGTRRVPFEVKLHSSPTAEDAQGLRRCMRDLDLPHGYIIYPGRERYSLGQGVIALPAEPLLARPESVRGL